MQREHGQGRKMPSVLQPNPLIHTYINAIAVLSYPFMEATM